MSISNNNFRGSRKPTKKCAMKIKKEKNDGRIYPRVINILMEGSSLYGCYTKDRKGF